jgi:alpha-D-ribose 1-methylphosphonate 5-triphosphate synthase subunit PhnH
MRFTGPQQLSVAARGFANPVLDAQTTFRSVLSALAEPGTLHAVATPAECCPGFSSAMTALALTLADFETRLWLDAGSEGAAAGYLRFHTGAPVATSAIDATFAFITQPATMLRLSNFAQGSLDYPDTSCTIVVDVRAIVTTRGFRLTGPGIPGARRLHVAPLPETFAADIANNRAAFPLGVDLLFCLNTTVAALPRTTLVTGSNGD